MGIGIGAAILGATGLSAIGGMVGGKYAYRGAKLQAEAAERGAMTDAATARYLNQKNREYALLDREQDWQRQQQMAAFSGTWDLEQKLALAKREGIHPLAMLGQGGGVSAYQPSSIIGDTKFPKAYRGEGLAEAGQAVGNAIHRTMNSFQKATMYYQLKNLDLKNKLLETHVAERSRALNKQAQVDSPVVNIPMRKTINAKGDKSSEPGATTFHGWAHMNKKGTQVFKVPSQDVKQKIEDVLPAETVWAGKAYAGHYFGSKNSGKPPKKMLPKGYVDWEKDYTTPGAWKAVKWRTRTWWNQAKDWWTSDSPRIRQAKKWEKMRKMFKMSPGQFKQWRKKNNLY